MTSLPYPASAIDQASPSFLTFVAVVVVVDGCAGDSGAIFATVRIDPDAALAVCAERWSEPGGQIGHHLAHVHPAVEANAVPTRSAGIGECLGVTSRRVGIAMVKALT